MKSGGKAVEGYEGIREKGVVMDSIKTDIIM